MFKGVTLSNCALLIEPYLQNLGTYMFLLGFFQRCFFKFFFQTNLITIRNIVLNINDFVSLICFLEAFNVNKPTSSGSVAVTLGGTVGSSVIVIIGVILAYFAIRYALNPYK